MTVLVIMGNGIGIACKQRKQGYGVASHVLVMSIDADMYMLIECNVGLMRIDWNRSLPGLMEKGWKE